MATTSYSAIRDKQRQVIEALTPTSNTAVKFFAALDERDFREWAVANKAAAFRRFTILNNADYQAPEVDNHDVVWQRMTSEIVVAYPNDWGFYGEENIRDMQDMMDEDWQLIDKNVGPYGQNLGNWLDGQGLCLMTSIQYIDDEDVTFAVIRYEIGFYRAR